MFSNSRYRWKLAIALAAIAAMGVTAARRGESINPEIWRCVAEPERWNGARLWVPTARIAAVHDGWFEIAAGDPEARLRVDGRPPEGRGDFLTLTGTFHADGPRLEMDRARIFPPHARLRWLLEAVSVAVVLVVLANFARHFLFRPKLLQVEGDPRG